MIWNLTWLFGASSWIVLILTYWGIGLVGKIVLAKLRRKYEFHISGLIRVYVGIGLLLVILMLPGSLDWFYEPCLTQGQMTKFVAANFSGWATSPVWEVLQQKLIELGSHCAGNVLVELDGKPIYLYDLYGCTAFASPTTIYDKQLAEITKLKEQYTVLAVSCDNYSDQPRS